MLALLTDKWPKALLVVVFLAKGVLAQRAPTTQSEVVTRTYDVGELAISVEDFDPPPTFDQWGFPTHIRGQMFGEVPTQTTFTREKFLADLASKIEFAVAPESWKDNGGQIGSIRTVPSAAKLIIDQTSENHELIGALLDIWRREKQAQVNIETRFIGRLGDLSNKPPIPGKWIDENGVRRWSEFLNQDQADKLIAQLQQMQDATTLTAPRMTLFNHQRAYVVTADTTSYIAENTARKLDNGFTTFDPVIKNVPSGILLDLRATLSDDRKNVKLAIHTVLNRLQSLEAVASPGSDPAMPAYYQVPHVLTASIDTTMDVPDGKTLLIQITPRMQPPTTAPSTNPQSFPPSNLNFPSIEGPAFVLVKPRVIVPR